MNDHSSYHSHKVQGEAYTDPGSNGKFREGGNHTKVYDRQAHEDKHTIDDSEDVWIEVNLKKFAFVKFCQGCIDFIGSNIIDLCKQQV